MNILFYRIHCTRHNKQRSFPYPGEYSRVAAHAIIRIEGWKDILCRLSALASVTEEVNCRRQVGPDVKKFNVCEHGVGARWRRVRKSERMRDELERRSSRARRRAVYCERARTVGKKTGRRRSIFLITSRVQPCAGKVR